MFSLLLDKLPSTVEIEGIGYRINTDFRTMILFELMMQDSELDSETKIINSLDLFYIDMPNDLEMAIEKLLWFYRCNEDEESTNNTVSTNNSTNIYNYEYDSEYIFSAFLDQYSIDLNSIEYLHWFKFKALFRSLKEDNVISKIMGYRGINLSEIEDDEERERYRKLQELYRIPNEISKIEKEKISEMENILMN